MAFISRQLQYNNTPNIQNIFALLDIHDLYQSVKLYQCTLENSFQILLKTRPHNL